MRAMVSEAYLKLRSKRELPYVKVRGFNSLFILWKKNTNKQKSGYVTDTVY